MLLNVAGPEPLLRGKPYLPAEEVNRLGAEIVRLNPFSTPLSVHHPTGDDAFKDAPWHTYGTLQGPKTFSRQVLRDGLLVTLLHAFHQCRIAMRRRWCCRNRRHCASVS